jgi:hypothetical protein
MDDAIVLSTIIGSVFSIIGLLILDRNWFRRERFKFDQDTQKKEMTLRFKKMARELGLDSKLPPYRPPASNPTDVISGLLPLLKNINPDQLGAIADILGGQEAEGGGEAQGGVEGLVDFAVKNPEILKGVTDFIKQKSATGGNESQLL